MAMGSQGGETHFVVTASGAGLYSQHRLTMGPYVASKHCAVVIAQVYIYSVTFHRKSASSLFFEA
jgi:hypothetical protein